MIVNASEFTSAAALTFIGSDDKDINVNFVGGLGNDTLTTGKITEDGGDTLTGGLGIDTFNIIASDQAAEVTDLGTGGSDVLVVTSLARGVVATVKEDYRATTSTSNSKSIADVVLNAASGIDINMVDASGLFGYVINGGSSSSNLEGSNLSDSISGNAGIDTLYGNKGNDTIEGGGGADIMNAGRGVGLIKDAGNGADIITHDQGSALVVYNTGVDIVTIKPTRPGLYLAVNVASAQCQCPTSTAAVIDGRVLAKTLLVYGGFGATVSSVDLSAMLYLAKMEAPFTGSRTDTISVGNEQHRCIYGKSYKRCDLWLHH